MFVTFIRFRSPGIRVAAPR